jgi:hypothetical protein
MMGCIMGVTFVTDAHQLPVRRGHACPMDTFLLVLSTLMSSVFSAYITFKSMILDLWDVRTVKLTCQTPTGRGIINGEKFITFYH